MDSTTRIVLGKRGRHVTGGEQTSTNSSTPPKRSRARRAERLGADSRLGSSALKSPNGLPTPEPSTLTESQTLPPATDLADAPLPKHIFPFMKLPAELRIHIYYMALVRNEPITLHIARVPDKPDEDLSPSATPPRGCSPPTRERSESPTAALFAAETTPPPRAWQNIANNPLGPSSPGSSQPSTDECAQPQPKAQTGDAVVPVLLRLNKQIHKEARQLLYAENIFTLHLSSGIHTLSTLHQRSRSLIKHVVLTIPSHHDILDGFADLVRLGLRYCWGLKSFRIILQASLPDDGRIGGATSVYANAFHILRWLPRGCSVVLEGCVSETVRKVVVEEGRLMSVLDEASYLKRQHQMPERH
ncbi:hypothetical protein BDU57DRAFT_524344 [Ampelomyces quisqualis]|uniref:Uncharacterized protein n=1 Tax=Ampelomyces quisqualis TaxID=50730 RepID=A0A6A5Q8X9_AMPQU|nr:hypothetical protein BDU57DRAFT_524344 [Ampelomyces quisqualis]